MAIEAQLFPNNAPPFPFYGSKNLMADNSQAAYGHRQQPVEQHHAWQMNQNMPLVDPNFSCFSNSNVHHYALHKNVIQPLASYPQSLAIVFDQQREIDHCIRSQVSLPILFRVL